MGSMDFVRAAGAKIFEGLSPAVREQALRDHVALFVDIADLSVSLDGGVVTLHGTVEAQSEAEKAALAAGNVNGVAAVDNQIEVGNPRPEANHYTVRQGDTLPKIAKRFYGNALKYQVILRGNMPMLSDPEKIYPGQVLRIPNLDDVAAAARAQSEEAAPPVEAAGAESPADQETRYYYARDAQRKGQHTAAEIAKLMSEFPDSDHKVWTPSFGSRWRNASEVPEISGLPPIEVPPE